MTRPCLPWAVGHKAAWQLRPHPALWEASERQERSSGRTGKGPQTSNMSHRDGLCGGQPGAPGVGSLPVWGSEGRKRKRVLEELTFEPGL